MWTGEGLTWFRLSPLSYRACQQNFFICKNFLHLFYILFHFFNQIEMIVNILGTCFHYIWQYIAIAYCSDFFVRPDHQGSSCHYFWYFHSDPWGLFDIRDMRGYERTKGCRGGGTPNVSIVLSPLEFPNFGKSIIWTPIPFITFNRILVSNLFRIDFSFSFFIFDLIFKLIFVHI